jgi:hypothetical protein
MSTIAESQRVARAGTRGRRAPKAGYWIALAVLMTGVALAVTWGVRAVVDAGERANALPRTAVPGELVVEVSEAGDQMVYFAGGNHATPASLGLQVTSPSGATIPLTTYDLILEVDLAGGLGRAVATFPADTQGAYVVTAVPTAGRSGSIAVGEDVAKDVLPDVLGALALAWFSVFVAVALAGITLAVRSSKAS